MISSSPSSLLPAPTRCIIQPAFQIHSQLGLIQAHSVPFLFHASRCSQPSSSIKLDFCHWHSYLLLSRTESRLFGLCLKHWCLLLYKALEGLADGREGLRDSVPVPAEGVMLEEGEGKAKARPDVIFSPLCQSGKSPACKTHVPRIPPIADQACTHPLTLIQNSHFSFTWLDSGLFGPLVEHQSGVSVGVSADVNLSDICP